MELRQKLLQWLVPFLVATAVTAYASYTHNDRAIAERITKVETKQEAYQISNDGRMDRMERKIDQILDKVYELGRQ